ncbi:MAG: endopeptidase La [Candidatus Glassbacteria bacterium]|nr:endopeptidase La [Candidatus Glassbacteria bacterium]
MTYRTISFIKDDEVYRTADVLPVLPLRDVVVFPYMVIPLMVGRPSSVAGIETAMLGDRLIILLAQIDGENEEPSGSDLYRVGVIARILQTVRLPDGTLKILVEGMEKVRVKRHLPARDYLRVRFETLPFHAAGSKELEALSRRALRLFEEYVRLNPRLPDELLTATANIDSPLRLGYMMAGHLLIRMSDKQSLLESTGLYRHLELVCQYLSAEMEILRLERKIDDNVKKQILKNQREFYLQEQLKAIHRELGQDDDSYDEIEELRAQAAKKKLPAEVCRKAEKEISKLSRMSMMSPEATVVRNYLDWLLSLPWKENTRDRLSVDTVARILDEDHYGLEKVKERIVEFIAVLKLVGELKGPILCFVGPPGVGKTSLGKSIARALGRRLVRLSLGGVRDEAEIRGHRRTYIGALPGKIIQAMKRAGVINPVILIDEVDKMSSDFRGDPSSALLEVLDPEQNNQFVDHYIEVDYDLSKVMFITTANFIQMIPEPLKDRMEIILLPGYLLSEKREIARRFLWPKQLKEHGLEPGHLVITDEAINAMIERYTREAGVRSLERQLGSICRKAARKFAVRRKRKLPLRITPSRLQAYLGVPKYLDTELESGDRVGLASGLAWTGAGGSILGIEVAPVAGKGRLTLTGKLGDVMKESAEAALTYVRSRSDELELKEDFYRKIDLHVHVPEGATPKDGPSAGVAIATAMVSALTGIPVRRNVAMTGEITLRGRVLGVGGLNEKSVAALRAGVETVIWPRQNEKDLADLPHEVREELKIRLVDSMDEVLEIALAGRLPAPGPLTPAFVPVDSGRTKPVSPYRH